MDQGINSSARRIALEVQYEGTHFNGWQIQNGGRTVQEEIEKAIHILFKEKNRVVAAGRTDAGVHALGQIIHFDTVRELSLQKICISLNGILPRDISVRNAYQVNNEFHARFTAVEREYQYRIYNHPCRTPFMMHRAMWVHEKLNCDYMRSVFDNLIGEMDFSSFCKKREVKNYNPVRRIKKIDLYKIDDIININITGNAFLHNMVRILVGTVVEMNKHEVKKEKIREIIAKKDREYSGITAPPYGLYLKKVAYEPPLSTMISAF